MSLNYDLILYWTMFHINCRNRGYGILRVPYVQKNIHEIRKKLHYKNGIVFRNNSFFYFSPNGKFEKIKNNFDYLQELFLKWMKIFLGFLQMRKLIS
ncbi:hypothetical protein [Legionella sp. MW5194]|uniref:hypothetical protein n=1 Tax=Legionella sp. MW5194 TaxID=2662448 RepID=UPI00351C6880